MSDKLRITHVDCSASPHVKVYSQMTESYHYGLSDGNGGHTANCPGDTCANGKVQIDVHQGVPGTPVDMTWNGGTSRWEYTGGCSSGDTIDVTSSWDGGTYTGSVSTTAP